MVVNSHLLYQLSYPGNYSIFIQRFFIAGWYKYHIQPILSMSYFYLDPRTLAPVDVLFYPPCPLFSSMITSLAIALSVSNTPVPSMATASKSGTARGVQCFFHLFQRHDVRQVPLVVLDDEGDFIQIISLFRQVDAEILDALDVRLHALDLRIRHEHDAVHALSG